MKKLKSILFVLFFSAITGLSAQNPYLKNADRLFNNYAYYEASVIYLSWLQQQYDYNANYQLAECYRMMNDLKQAEFWYDILVMQPVEDPQLYFRYAEVLRSNGKYALAKDNYLKYAVYDEEGYYFAGMCDWALTNLHNRSAYLIDTLSINTKGSEIASTFFKKGIIYSSNGNGNKNEAYYQWTGMPFYDLYFAEIEQGRVNKKSPVEGFVNSKAHDSAPCYDPVSKTLYFTRNSFYHNRSKQAKDGEIKLQLFYSDYADGYFTVARPLDINNRSYSSGQPAISPDGSILIFASDKPGGFGGTDLYYSVKTGKDWSIPKNMGQVVNTPGNEMFPFISEDGKLYFSSNRHLGYGGMDVFVCHRENEHWSVPENLGIPVNSSRDDFGFIIKNGKGFVSSNREGGKGDDDIYTVTQLNAVSGIFVHDPDMKGISGAKIYYTEGAQQTLLCVTDAYGYCNLSAKTGADLILKITHDGYLDNNTKNLNTIKTNSGIYPVELQPLIGNLENVPGIQIETPAINQLNSGTN